MALIILTFLTRHFRLRHYNNAIYFGIGCKDIVMKVINIYEKKNIVCTPTTSCQEAGIFTNVNGRRGSSRSNHCSGVEGGGPPPPSSFKVPIQ
jgi:hypothetical protein